ncbi:hypothetical protein HOY82DRAFT_480530, partial [Tuber indicum]
SSTAMRSLVEILAAENHIARVNSFSRKLVGMVLPNGDIKTKLIHASIERTVSGLIGNA